ncbi:MAG TPA: SRPBCC family protein [Casimicrobiaceae bacterium]|jgi:uncharacterized protein YndB with AHSA1/START domain
MSSTLRVTRRYGMPPERVFDAWINPAMARIWLFATALRPMARVQIDARAGGAFRLVDEHDGGVIEYAGEYVEVSPYRRLIFTLKLNNPRDVLTRVTVEVTRLKMRSRLTLLHENVPPHTASDQKARWIGILYGLGVTLAASNLRSEFFESHCRFRASPIDYRVDPQRSTMIRSDP